MSEQEFDGKVVWVTGASRGIGRAVAERFARAGARLVICGRDAEALDDLSTSIGAGDERATILGAFDLQEDASLERFMSHALEEAGPPDVLINNAGFNPRKAPVHEVGIEEFDSILSVNLRAPFLLMRRVFPLMKERGSGSVVNVLSTVCHASMETMGAYSAAKSGLEALTDIFRKEARAHGVRVASIYPGGTNTAFRPNERKDYMSPDSVAAAIYAALTLPDDLVVHDMTFRPMVESNF